MTNLTERTEKYNTIVGHAELRQICLVRSEFSVNPHYFELYEEADKFIENNILDEPAFVEDEGVLLGQVRCCLWMSHAELLDQHEPIEGLEKDRLLNIQADYLVAFDIPELAEPSLFSSFFKRTAVFSVWAYFRSHVATIASEAGIEVPILPIKRLHYPIDSSEVYTQNVAAKTASNGN